MWAIYGGVKCSLHGMACLIVVSRTNYQKQSLSSVSILVLPYASLVGSSGLVYITYGNVDGARSRTAEVSDIGFITGNRRLVRTR